jgi:hypothetical protein
LFDPGAALVLAELGVSPEQAAVRTRDGGGDIDTVAHKVANGDLTARGGAVPAGRGRTTALRSTCGGRRCS